jgi:excisionase family DNA binding protein
VGDNDLREVTGQLTITQAAQHAGLSPATIRDWIRSGRLPSQRMAGRRFIHSAVLAATQAAAHVGWVVPPGGETDHTLAGASGCCGKRLE